MPERISFALKESLLLIKVPDTWQQLNNLSAIASGLIRKQKKPQHSTLPFLKIPALVPSPDILKKASNFMANQMVP